MRPTRLARSIHAVLAAALATAAPGAFAADSPADGDAGADTTTLDAAPGQAAATIQPAMTVITREEIDRSGDFSVADLLRDSVLAPYGSYRPQSGSTWQSFSGLDLRGLHTRSTLVLIDGRRIAPYALGPDAGFDLNAIPLAMVERIEIVPEGASARYGTDAVAGVVNIVTRDMQGAELRIGVGDPSTTGGDLDEMSATFGADTERTHLVGGAAKNSRGITFRRHQPGGDAVAVSSYGNSYYDWFTGRFETTPGFACDSDGFFEANGTCLYDLNTAAADDASIDNKSVFVRGEHAIDDDWSVFFAASTAKAESFGRYAPTPAELIVQDGTPNDINAGVACGVDGCAPGTTDGLPTYYFHRFAAAGNRDTRTDSQVSEYAVGFRGALTDAFDIEVGLQRSDYDAIEIGRGNIVRSLAEAAANRGDYLFADPFGTDPNVIAGFTATTSREASYVRDAAFATGTLDWHLPTGLSQLRFGLEAASEDYHDIYDSLSTAGAVLGTAGVPAADMRDTQSAWIEWALPLAANLHATLAGRHDRIETGKVESTFSPKLTLAWQPLDWLGARASWGESFHAPSLHLTGRAPVDSVEPIIDPVICFPIGCQYFVDVTTVGNPELDAEQAEHWSVGVELRPTPWLVASVDYWDVGQEKRHWELSAYHAVLLTDLTQFSGELPEGVTVVRSPGGYVQSVVTGPVNLGSVDTRGVDLRVATEFDFGDAGRLRNRLDLTKVLDYDLQVPWYDYAGEDSFAHPSLRASLANVWTLGDWELGWTVHHIGDHGGGFEPAVDAWTTHDLSVAWQAPWNATLALGATNVADEEPDLEAWDDRPYNFYLYDGAGRTVWARYTQRF